MQIQTRVTLLVLAVLGLAITAAASMSWPEQSWPTVATSTGVAACTDDYCDCPEAAGALLCHDFEEGETDCAVATASGFLGNLGAALGEIGYVANFPDCADATAPLDGTYSVHMEDAAANTDTLSWWPVGASGDTNICESTFGCVITGLVNINSDDGSALGSIVEMDSSCDLRANGAANTFMAVCTAGADTAASFVNGTTYKFCLKYVSDECSVAIDPEGGTYCEGASGTGSVAACTGAHAAVDNVYFSDAVDHVDVNFDNLMIVPELP